jgi:hypothetical protein
VEGIANVELTAPTETTWTTDDLAARWGVRRQTVRWYILAGKLAAWQHAKGSPFYIASAEMRRFEREELPNIKTRGIARSGAVV